MKMVILFVTWFYPGQPPASSQAQFNSMETCTTARESILRDAARLKSDEERKVQELRKQGTIYNPGYPTVSAVCATQ
jgi:hypothetical protein